jgi:hypothetical protein
MKFCHKLTAFLILTGILVTEFSVISLILRRIIKQPRPLKALDAPSKDVVPVLPPAQTDKSRHGNMSRATFPLSRVTRYIPQR